MLLVLEIEMDFRKNVVMFSRLIPNPCMPHILEIEKPRILEKINAANNGQHVIKDEYLCRIFWTGLKMLLCLG